MADTLEYSEVGFARDRFTDELIAEIEVIIKHVYIEQAHQDRIHAGHVYDVFPYDKDKRFRGPQA